MRASTPTTLALVLMLAACSATTPKPDNTNASSSAPDSSVSSEATEPTAFERSGVVEMDAAASSLTFLGRSNIINHDGAFEKFDATLTLDETTPDDLTAATIEITIDTRSVIADAAGLTGHLRKADFFDTENFPEATFTSTSIEAVGNDDYAVTGDLTIKGVTKPVTVNTTITNDGMVAQFDLMRKDFGIGNDSYGDKLLDEEVPVTANIVFAD